MDRKSLLWIVAFVIAVIALPAGWQLASAQGEKGIQKWEYKESRDKGELAKLGDDGWELVAVEPPMPYVPGGETVRHTSRIFHLKRAK